jgi:hypothetical protein
MHGFKCIAEEAELITEWLMKWGLRYLADKEYVLCHRIRWIAHDLFGFLGEWSIYIAAALLVRACLPLDN